MSKKLYYGSDIEKIAKGEIDQDLMPIEKSEDHHFYHHPYIYSNHESEAEEETHQQIKNHVDPKHHKSLKVEHTGDMYHEDGNMYHTVKVSGSKKAVDHAYKAMGENGSKGKDGNYPHHNTSRDGK